jgi:hypothetical protein
VSLIDFPTNPSLKQLRQFGLLSLVLFPAIAWWWTGFGLWALGALGFGALFGILGFAKPILLKPIFLGSVIITRPIGLILGEVLILLIFAFAITPIALGFRCFKHDPLQRKIGSSSSSYWKKKIPARDFKTYYRQF